MEDIKELSAETTDSEVDTTLDEGASEVADTSENDVEFTDTSEDAEEDKEETKAKEQEKETKQQKTNADYARERRKAEHEAALKKARNEAIIDALNGENPYTHEKMEDDADIQEYLTMKEIAKNGGDPIADYSKHIKAKAKEEEKATQEKVANEEWVRKDKEDFVAKHPDVNLSELVEDDLFRTFALGKIGKMSMDKIYTDYQTFTTKSEERAKERAAQLLANSAATPGKLTSQQPPKQKSIEDMSKEEFEKLQERVKGGERIIL